MTADTRVEALLMAQLVVQGSILQVLEAHTGVHSRSVAAALVSLGLTQSEVGQVLGKDQSWVSRSVSTDRKKSK